MQKQKGFIISLVIAVVVVAILGTGGYFVYKQYSAPKEQPKTVACTQEAKVCPDDSSVGRTGPNCEFAVCPIAQNQTDQTASWEIYKNNKYGYELKYPKGWFVFWSKWTEGGPLYYKEEIDQRDDVIIASKYPRAYQEMNSLNWIQISKQGGIWTENSNTVDDFWNKLGKKDPQTGEIINRFVEKKRINNTDFIFFEQYNWSVKSQKKVWEQQALFMYNREFFWVRRSEIMDAKLFTQMLSTFKFTK